MPKSAWTRKAAEPKAQEALPQVEPKAEEPVVAVELAVELKVEGPAVEVFTPDGVVLPDGSVCYAVFCNGGFSTSGVYWSTVVPPGTTKEVYLAVQAERDEARRKLAELSRPPV